MRVLLLNAYHYARGGSETHALALAELLEARGHEVRFFGMQHEENQPSPDSEFWVDEIDFAQLNSHKTPRAATQVMGRTFYYRGARRQLDRMLDAWTPDVAHIHNIHGHISPSVLDSLAARDIPTVWTLHDYRLLCPNSHFLSGTEICERCRIHRYWNCVVHRCKKGSVSASTVAALEATVHAFLRIPEKVDRFIAPSRFLRDKFIEFGYPADKITFIRNFLPEGLEPMPLRPDGPAVYIGRLSREKGVEAVVSAIAALPDRRLVVVGGGPDRERLEELAERLGVRDRVRFAGTLDRAGVLGALAESSFVVVPSVWYENCPYSVMEAQAAGRPVVASACGALPELVRDGGNGLTFPPSETEALAEAMRSLWDDPQLLARLAAGSVSTAAEYAPDVFYGHLMELYAEVTAST